MVSDGSGFRFNGQLKSVRGAAVKAGPVAVSGELFHKKNPPVRAGRLINTITIKPYPIEVNVNHYKSIYKKIMAIFYAKRDWL